MSIKQIANHTIAAFFVMFSITIFASQNAAAIIADYEETVTRQKTLATSVVEGVVVSSSYVSESAAGIENSTQSVNYKIEITKALRGISVGTGAIIDLSHNCNAASEMFVILPKQLCISTSPKTGDTVTVYLTYAKTQAVIYEDEVLNIDLTNSKPTAIAYLENNTILCIVVFASSIAGAILLVLMITNHEKKKMLLKKIRIKKKY